MPTGEPTAVGMMPAMIVVPAISGLMININVQSDGSPEGLAAIEATSQSLIDHLQTWEGKVPTADVTGQLYDTTYAPITPTNPVPIPDPEPDPNG